MGFPGLLKRNAVTFLPHTLNHGEGEKLFSEISI